MVFRTVQTMRIACVTKGMSTTLTAETVQLHLESLCSQLHSLHYTSPKDNREIQHSVDELKPGHPKERGTRLAEAVGDNSLGELYNSLQCLRVPSIQSALTQTTLVVRVFLLAVGKRSLWDASPGVMSQPPVSLVGSRVAALAHGPPLHGTGSH